MLFISDYPNEETIKDGMLQRVKAIDKHFEDEERTYLCISVRRFIKKRTQQLTNNCTLINCNLFVHFLFIYKLLKKNRTIYIHSVHNGLYIVPFCVFITHLKVILDVHGAVPEELRMRGKRIQANLLEYIEKYFVKHAAYLIVVTERMKLHLIQKHSKFIENKWITYPILPYNTLEGDVIDTNNEKKDKIVIIYSGNTQSWQNIDLMMNIIRTHIENDLLEFVILTGEVHAMQQFLIKHNIDKSPNLTLASVQPDELKPYYLKANYGFILRDDDIINKVACPTKMIEYLRYGIIPIVKTHRIGDFENYDYVPVNNLKSLKNIKSTKNATLIMNMMEKYAQINLREMLNS